MNVTIDKLAYGGDGVARPGTDETVVFVSRAAAGDRLKVEIVEQKPRFRRARILKVLEPGPERTQPPCGYYSGPDEASSCGGCHLQHLGYAAQLAAKEEQVQDAIKRIGGVGEVPLGSANAREWVAPTFHPAIAAPKPLGYRNKATFHWNAAAGRFGLVAVDQKTVLPIVQCPLLAAPVDEAYRAAAGAAEAIAARDPLVRAGLITLVVRAGIATGQTLVALVVKPSAPASLAEEFGREVLARGQVTSILVNVNPSPDRELFGDAFTMVHGGPTILEKIGGVSFVLDPETFLQVNTEQAATLFGVAVAAAKLTGKERVLDLFCGNGGLALSAARAAKEVIGVETVAGAVKRGRESAMLNGIENVRFRVGRVESTLKTLFHGEKVAPDVVFVDPPRAGLKPLVIETLVKMKPKRVVYVSCNPTTLARDLKLFVKGGWVVRDVTPVDLFPQTYHVEAVVTLERGSP